MKVLLDTHAFLWWASEPERLSARARRQIASATNEIFVSVASIWEMAIKTSNKQLRLSVPVDRFVPERLTESGFQALPVSISHALAVSRLPSHHLDPFDRILVAQAIVEGLTLVTGDRQVKRYAVKVLW